MSTPTVLLVAQQVRGVRSGVGTYGRMLLAGLKALDLAVTVATWSEERDEQDFPWVTWLDLGPRPRFDPTPGGFYSLGRRVAHGLAGRRFDLVHFLDAREGHAFVRADHAMPVVGTIHDDYAAHAPLSPLGLRGRAADPLRRWLYYRWLKRLEKRAYRAFDALMVNSSATRDSIVTCYGVAPGRLHDLALCVPAADPVAPEVLPGRPALLFSGGNFFRKGLDVLVRSLHLLTFRLPAIHLHVAGHDPAERRIRGLAQRLGVAHHVTFHGRVPPERMAAMTAGADLFVMPSRREALGLVYLEAFRANVPAIAGSLGGAGDIVVDGESGLLVPPEEPRALADAILRLEADAFLRARLALGGRRVLEARTPARLVHETLSVYRAVAPALAAAGSRTSEGDAGAGAAASASSQRDPVTSSKISSSRRPIAAGENVKS